MKRKSTGYYPALGDYKFDGIDARSYSSKESIGSVDGAEFIKAQRAPFLANGPRVPDACSYPTTTSTLRMEVTHRAQGNAGALCAGGVLYLASDGVYYCPEVANVTNEYIKTVSGGVTSSVVSSDDSIKHTGLFTGGAAGTTENTWTDYTSSEALGTSFDLDDVKANYLVTGYDQLKKQFSSMRIVGAGLDIQYIGNDQTNEGLISTASLNSRDIMYQTLINKTYASNASQTLWYPVGVINAANQGWQKVPEKTVQVALNSLIQINNFRNNYQGPAKHGAYMTASALDNKDYEFGLASNTTGSNLYGNESGAGSYAIATLEQRNLGALQWHASQINSAARFRVFIVVHVEGIALADNVVVQEQAICIDPISEQLAPFIHGVSVSSVDRSRVESQASLQVTLTNWFQSANIPDGVRRTISNVVTNAIEQGTITTQAALQRTVDSMIRQA
jgi:hypothetical protein